MLGSFRLNKFANSQESGKRDFSRYVAALLQILTIFAIEIAGIDFSFGEFNFNSERALLPLVIVVLIFSMFNQPAIFNSAPVLLFTGWFLSAVISTILSGSIIEHLRGLAITSAPFFYFLLFVNVGLSRAAFKNIVEISLWILSVGSVVVFVSWKLNGSFADMIDRDRVMFTMQEPNILGCLIVTFILLHYPFFRMTIYNYILYIFSFAALIFTQSKAPYLAYLFATLYYIYNWRSREKLKIVAFICISATILTILIIVNEDMLYKIYLATLDRPDAVANRMFALERGWQRFLDHPIFGNGPLDFSISEARIISLMGSSNIQNAWIWQIWVAVLHDEGLLGFVMFIGTLGAAWMHANRMAKQDPLIYTSFRAAMLGLLICSQVTTVHLTALFGVVLGLLCSRVRGAASRRPHLPTTRTAI